MLNRDAGLRHLFCAEHVARLACLLLRADVGCCTLRPNSSEVAIWASTKPFWNLPPWVNDLAALVEQLGRPGGSSTGIKKRAVSFHFGPLIALPVLREGAVLGAIGVATQEPRLWAGHQRERLEEVARYAAVQVSDRPPLATPVPPPSGRPIQ
ncbi:MAG: hypothetical protein HOW73_05235 [Polyangiaceae bacterium]|nr:hypothetical protein [Polyangiaceae bacterium]